MSLSLSFPYSNNVVYNLLYSNINNFVYGDGKQNVSNSGPELNTLGYFPYILLKYKLTLNYQANIGIMTPNTFHFDFSKQQFQSQSIILFSVSSDNVTTDKSIECSYYLLYNGEYVGYNVTNNVYTCGYTCLNSQQFQQNVNYSAVRNYPQNTQGSIVTEVYGLNFKI